MSATPRAERKTPLRDSLAWCVISIDIEVTGEEDHVKAKGVAMRHSAVGYVRVSTERQAEEGLGLAIQERAIRHLARTAGLKLQEIVRDEGVNGTLEERPGLASLLDSLRPGMVVVVARLDRLARDLLTQEFLLRDMRQRGADLVSCSQAEADYLRDDPDDPTRKLIRQVLGAVSEFERALIKLRLSRGRAAKAAKGGFAYGSPPYGSRAADRKLVPEESEQAVIELATRLRREGASLRSIGRSLLEAGHSPRRAKAWHPQVVARLLRREAGPSGSRRGRALPS